VIKIAILMREIKQKVWEEYLGSDNTDEAVSNFGDTALHNIQIQALHAQQNVALQPGLRLANHLYHHLVRQVCMDLHLLQAAPEHVMDSFQLLF